VHVRGPVLHHVVCHLRQVGACSAQAGDGAGDEQGEPVAAGIDHAVLTQHGQQIGSALDRLLRRLQGAFEHLREHGVLLLVGGLAVEPGGGHVRQLCRHAVGHLAHDRDHRALGGIAHGRVSGLCGLCKRSGDELRIDELARPAGELLGSAAHDLGEDHAAVAARSQQRSTSDGLHDLVAADVVDHLTVEAIELLHHGAQRVRHVVAGVAVGDGEHVEVVDLLAACLQLRTCSGNDFPESLYRGIGQDEPTRLLRWPCLPCRPSGSGCRRKRGGCARRRRCAPSGGLG
jgi:hypothetical protein